MPQVRTTCRIDGTLERCFPPTDRHAAGLGVLFSKLQQGVVENRQVLTIARMRAEAEEAYGQRLSEIAPAADKIQGGFSKDDGASVRKVRSPLRPARRCNTKLTALLLRRHSKVYEPRWWKAQGTTRRLPRTSAISS